ncbi:MAG: hypothetical protein AAFP69_01665 [Planctomycetota bacterium]
MKSSLSPVGAAIEMSDDGQQGVVVVGIDFNCDSTGQANYGRIQVIGGRSGIQGHQLVEAAAVLGSLVSEPSFPVVEGRGGHVVIVTKSLNGIIGSFKRIDQIDPTLSGRGIG